MRRKLAIDPRQIEHRCNRTHLVIVRHHLFKAERIKQLSLILLQPTHHGPFPPLTASTSGNHCSRKPSTDFCNKICHNRTRTPANVKEGVGPDALTFSAVYRKLCWPPQPRGSNSRSQRPMATNDHHLTTVRRTSCGGPTGGTRCPKLIAELPRRSRKRASPSRALGGKLRSRARRAE